MIQLRINKGISLIELLVAVGLGLLLIFSMLAFYSISQKNSTDFHAASHEQQSLRKMMNIISKDIENTGGFECAIVDDQVFLTNHYPKSIVSIGSFKEEGGKKTLLRKQIIFTHPIIEEYLQQSLGIFKVGETGGFKSSKPLAIKAGCGRDKDSSPIYVGTTILETISLDDKTNAFVALSTRSTDAIDNPKITDSVVLYTYPKGSEAEPKIFLGFSPSLEENSTSLYTHIPTCTQPDPENCLITSKSDFEKGGWLDPFSTNLDFLLQLTKGYTDINKQIHGSSDDRTYSLTPEAIKQIRAVKFQFKLDAGTDKERTITRVIRFKNTHLMKLEK